MIVYKFKVKGFSTILVGQMYTDKVLGKIFFVERADGTRHKYDEGIIEFYEIIYSEDTNDKTRSI